MAQWRNGAAELGEDGSPMTSETRLQRLEDRQAIANLKARYVDAADGGWTGERAHDGDTIASLFVEDGVWDAGEMGRGVGHAGIRAYFAAVDGFPLVFHHTSSARILVEGDLARGRWHVMVPLIDDGVSKLLIGIYDDRFVRTPEGWKFVELRFTPASTIDLPAGWQVL
jgi:hypothetical protein